MTVALEPGAVIAGRYRLDRLIGEGGMGVVWAATHLETGKAVALKHLRDEASGDAETRKRFLREAQATARIAHPNIVAVHDLVETEGGLPAIVMDLLDGKPLRARLDRERRLSLEQTASILLPAVSAVGTAHAIGIVHRDLKPDNIFIARMPAGEDRSLVLDFGIAKLTKPAEVSTASVITGTWSLLGTPHYMSPEQIIGEKDIDHRTDIWAMGAILYECLAGVRPAEAKTPGKIFELILLRGIKPLSERVPDLPGDVADLVLRMLARERDDRPWDLHEAEAVLARYTTVRAPKFGAPATIRLSSPGHPRISARALGPEPAANDPLSTTAPDLRDIVSSLDFNEPASSREPSTQTAPGTRSLESASSPPSTQSAPSFRDTQNAPETLPSPGVQDFTPAGPPRATPVTTAAAPPLNEAGAASPDRRVKRAPLKLPAAAIPILVAVGAAGAGAGAWILLTPDKSGEKPQRGTENPAPGGSGSAAAGAGACPPDMVFIAGGAFLMGSNEGKEDERPVHRVEVRPFCMDRTEVTVRAYTACAVEGACSPAEPTVTWSGIPEATKALDSSFCLAYLSDRMDHPINCIDWNQAEKFCRARKKRLPSEEEWELAARGGSDQRRFPWGDEPPGPDLSNLCATECREGLKKRGREVPSSGLAGDDGFFQTAPVGHFAKGASKEGLVDMMGNVAEWTSSPYCPYPSHTCSNPARVFRGGGWMTFAPPSFTPTARLHSQPSHRFADIGFRCASPVK